MTGQHWIWEFWKLHYGLWKQTVAAPALNRPFSNDQAEHIETLPKLILNENVRAILDSAKLQDQELSKHCNEIRTKKYFS